MPAELNLDLTSSCDLHNLTKTRIITLLFLRATLVTVNMAKRKGKKRAVLPPKDVTRNGAVEVSKTETLLGTSID